MVKTAWTHSTRPLQTEFCEIKKKYDAARDKLEQEAKEISELIQVKHRALVDVVLLLDSRLFCDPEHYW